MGGLASLVQLGTRDEAEDSHSFEERPVLATVRWSTRCLCCSKGGAPGLLQRNQKIFDGCACAPLVSP